MEHIRLKSHTAKFLANGRAITSQNQFTYMLRSCHSDMSAYGGFQWPRRGQVECPDWSPRPVCGRGLHGLLMGQGDVGLTAVNAPTAMWLVCAVWAGDVVELFGKVKVPRAWVAFTGSRSEAVAHMQSLGANLCAWATVTGGVNATVTGGYGATVTGGYGATVTGGYGATVTGGVNATVTGGVNATVTGGHGATVTGGDSATVTGGVNATLVLKGHDGKRYRSVVAYVGENGIEPNVQYKLDAQRKFVRA